jgi:hypothetical protein
MRATVWLDVDASVDHVLQGLLQQRLPEVHVATGSLGDAKHGDLVIVGQRKWNPDAVHALISRRLLVVVVASLPSAAQARAFRRAGASDYLSLDLDLTALASCVERLLSGPASRI